MRSSKELNDWSLSGKKCGTLSANVPGDISYDLYSCGAILDPYYGLNHLDESWIINSDFVYRTEFDADDEMLRENEVILEFEGIDTFSEIYLNGTLLGRTDNMFLSYSYNVKELVKKAGNILEVKMLSTIREMNKVCKDGYFGTFNSKRMFIRKAQCHFGWDWAPDIPGYGIYKPVKIYGASSKRINDVTYRAYNDGKISFITELNYNVRSLMDFQGNAISEVDEVLKNTVIRYTLASLPDLPVDEALPMVKQQKVSGSKNFINFEIEDPKLWWPVGYGEHPLYSYRVELLCGDAVLDSKEGRMAFREVALSQKPLDETSLEYKLSVNGVPVFVRGSNWVPIECFTGIVKDEKYKKLISLANDGNVNMLRVWGGGIYENDVFYDTCDETGILVWQDMMFACSDIPEDDEYFVENCKKEIDYQIRRLRNHPSIVYWCGGNEKTGSYGLQISKGDYFIDVILRGLITNLDDTRPFARQSPCSLTEIGNDMNSGESHASSYEEALLEGADKYRELVAKKKVPFVSESATMGPGSLESLKKIFPEDKLWPMNEYWDDRLMDNPYAAVLMPFAKRQKYYADELYGETKTIESFIAKGMTTHAETIRAEAEYARYNEGITWGFMNWMFSDIWPSGTWSVIDYYCEPKQAYYQMKRSYAPVLTSFVQGGDGKTRLTVVNDTRKSVSGELEYGLQDLNGNVIWSEKTSFFAESLGAYKIEIDKSVSAHNAFLYAKGTVGGEDIYVVYSQSMWKGYELESDYTYKAEESEQGLCVTVKANKFAKGVTLRLPDNYRYLYSDNYFDLPAGEEKTVVISGATLADADRLVVTDFAKEIAYDA